jgi:V/A-type H+-transporting ATPase subunit E
MVDEIRDLIEKINQEGIRAAEGKARAIEAAARQRADEILIQARLEEERMIAAAEEKIRREEANEKALLAQAGRDLLLSLRKEIQAMLGRIIASDTGQSLTPEALSRLVSDVVHRYSPDEQGDILVSLKKEDLEILEKHFLHRLREETKRTIVLRPAEEITGGFVISFDSGRSAYDFTDRALADYIGTRLKPKVRGILEDALKE